VNKLNGKIERTLKNHKYYKMLPIRNDIYITVTQNDKSKLNIMIYINLLIYYIYLC